MAGPGDLSSDPNSNGTIGGINVAENCPAGNLNNGIRYLAAMVRVTWGAIPDAADYVTRKNAVFLTQPTFDGRGGFLHHNDPANSSARLFVQPAGGAAPSGMANGDILIEY